MTPVSSVPRYPIVAWVERRTPRQRRFLLLLLCLAVLALTVRGIAGVVLDRWWYDSVGAGGMFGARIRAQVWLLVVGSLAAFPVVVGSVVRAMRIQGSHEPNRLIRQYRERIGPAHDWLLIGASVWLAARWVWSAQWKWQSWILFWKGPSSGVIAPEIGGDIGYHLFRLPFLSQVLGWLVGLLIAAMVGTGIAGLANGTLRLRRSDRRSSRRLTNQLALLASAFAALAAVGYVFVVRPQLATNATGTFDGPGFAELRAVAPGALILAAVAAIAAAGVLLAIRTKHLRRGAVILAGWAVIHVAIVGATPAVLQRLVVAPAEAERQMPYIEHNLDATRTAYALDRVESVDVDLADGIEAWSGIDLRIPVYSETQLVDALQVLQGTTATRITDVDLDRYQLDGEGRPVMLAVRNSNRADLPERGWVQEHLVYTHGDGVVAVPADAPAADGRPDVDALATFAPTDPQIYFGEGMVDWYVLVDTDRLEQGDTHFGGETGIPMNTLARRLILAAAVGDFEPAVTSELTDRTRLLMRRDIWERLTAVAPFLSFDTNAYPVITDDHVVWITDGYTTASTYPYAQRADTSGLTDSSDLAGRRFNYIRASVKATVDAYDGSIHLYRVGTDDLVLDAWEKAVPGLIEPISQLPASLEQHLQYPPDLLTVQTAMLGRYHVKTAEELFSGTDRWAVSAAPGNGVAVAGDGPSPAVSLYMPESAPEAGAWVAIRPLSPGAADKPTSGRDELSALAVANHDVADRLTLYRLAPHDGRQVASPQVAQSAIDADRDLASVFTLLNANGSVVQFGPMAPVIVDGGLVWTRSISVTGTTASKVPTLYGAVAVSRGVVGDAGSVEDAIGAATD